MRQSSARPIHCVTNRQRLHTTALTTKLHNNGFIFIDICFDYSRKDTKKKRHFKVGIKTKINHQLMATILLESGIHVMLIDSLYAFENNRHLNLDFVKTKRYERMNLGGRKYKITHKGFFLKKTLI